MFENCYVATTDALSATYDNGLLGVDATLTSSSDVALQIEGRFPQTDARVLVKNQTNVYQNGIYVVTTTGDTSTNWVLTRADDYNSLLEVNSTDVIPVTYGTYNGSTFWSQTNLVILIGTSSITMKQSEPPPKPPEESDSFVVNSVISTIPTTTTMALWAASLFNDFPQENIPILINELKWKEWGNQLVQLDSFSINSAPGCDDYSDWKTWALDVYNAVNW